MYTTLLIIHTLHINIDIKTLKDVRMKVMTQSGHVAYHRTHTLR